MVPRLREALLQSSKLCKEGGGEQGKTYADKEAAVTRLLRPPGYMRGRPVEAILEREAAEHLVARGTRPVEGGRLVFSRDRRFTIFKCFKHSKSNTKDIKHKYIQGGPSHSSTH